MLLFYGFTTKYLCFKLVKCALIDIENKCITTAKFTSITCVECKYHLSYELLVYFFIFKRRRLG